MMIQPANDSPDLTALERSVLETAFRQCRPIPVFATGSTLQWLSRARPEVSACCMANRDKAAVGGTR